MLSLSVNLLGWAPQKIKYMHKKNAGVCPILLFYVFYVFYFKGLLPPHSIWVHRTEVLLILYIMLINLIGQNLQNHHEGLGRSQRD